MFGIVDKLLAGASAVLLAALVGLWSYMHLWALPAEFRAGRAEGVRAERAQAAAELAEKNAMIERVSDSATQAWNERDIANRVAAGRVEAWPLPDVMPTAQHDALPKGVIDELNRIR